MILRCIARVTLQRDSACRMTFRRRVNNSGVAHQLLQRWTIDGRAYGAVLGSWMRAMGIRDRPISPGLPWQNPYVERLTGTVGRECLDRMLVFGKAHQRQISFFLCGVLQ